MKTKNRLFYLWILTVAGLIFTGQAKADLYWETRSVSVGIAGQTNGNSIQKYYFTPYASRVDLGAGKIIIVYYKTRKVYSLDTRTRTCTPIDLSRIGGIPGLSGKDQAKMSQLMGAMLGSQIVSTNKYRTIAGYRCREYFVHVAIVNGEYWVSKEVKGYRELKSLGVEAGVLAQYNPLFRQIDIADLVRKLDGFPVLSVNHVMGGTVRSTLTKIDQRSLPRSLFDIPRNYAMKKMP
ncbi:MAG: DUF4412 domain-containing protein [Syntrophobacteraceae bacterium]